VADGERKKERERQRKETDKQKVSRRILLERRDRLREWKRACFSYRQMGRKKAYAGVKRAGWKRGSGEWRQRLGQKATEGDTPCDFFERRGGSDIDENLTSYRDFSRVPRVFSALIWHECATYLFRTLCQIW
jgi:hypothetical protein